MHAQNFSEKVKVVAKIVRLSERRAGAQATTTDIAQFATTTRNAPFQTLLLVPARIVPAVAGVRLIQLNNFVANQA